MRNILKYILIPVLLSVFSLHAWAQTDTVQIDRVGHNNKVHIAYGSQTQQNVSSAISTITGDELAKGAVTNFSSTLFGKFPGLFVSQNGGAPGKDQATIRLRGGTQAPLIIIDGFERDMTFIAPEEIESLSVLKDASAVAIYGMKAANGAILITTKRGKAEEGRIMVSIQSGIQTPEKTMKVLGSAKYMQYYNEAAMNDGLPAKYSDTDIASAGSSPLYPDVDWKELLLKKMTNVSKANVGFIGGTDFVRYFVNVGVLYSDGIYKPENPDFNTNGNLARMNIRSNIDMDITKSTVFSLDMSGSVNKNTEPAYESSNRIWEPMMTLPPNAMNSVNPDGSYGGTSLFTANPLSMLELGGNASTLDHFLNASFKLKQNFDFITKGLSAGVTYVIDNGATNSSSDWRNINVREIGGMTGDVYDYYSYGETTQYTLQSNANSARNMSYVGDIVYDMPEFNGNKLDVLVRYQSDRQYLANSDLFPYLTNNLAGRIQYSNNNKYLLELSASYFGSDQYAEGNRYGFFPAASAAWVFSNESFADNSNFLSFGKLRASYGMTGYNRYVNGRYPYAQFYENGGSFPLGTDWTWFSGVRPDMLANPNIKWETSEKLNVGVDLELLEKITLSADFYNDKRRDVLYIDYNHPSVTGATLPYENIGELTSTGFDLSLGYNSKGEELNWSADLVFSYNEKIINEMGESQNMGDLANLNRTGNSVYTIYGYEQIGTFESESDIQSSPQQTFGTPRVGDLKYKDQNNDNIIDSRDITAISDGTARIDFGLRLGVSWKNFDAEAFIQGRLNNDINLSGNILAQPFIHGNAVTEIVEEADFPTLTLSNMNNYQSSSFWVRNGNFIKLRNIEFGYTLPEGSLSALHMENMRFFVRGVNVFTLSKWKYSDPEYTWVGYPPMKSFLLGVNVNF